MTLKRSGSWKTPPASGGTAGHPLHLPFEDRSDSDIPASASPEPQSDVFKWLETLLDAALVVDNRGTIAQVNAKAETLFGYTRAELIGHPVEMLMPAHQHAEYAKCRADIFAAPHPSGTGLELNVTHKDGTELPIAITLSTFTAASGPLALAVVRDITARKRSEAELKRHRDHLEELVEERAAELVRANEQLRQEARDSKRMETKIRESEEKYRRLFDNSGALVSVYDRDGICQLMNRKAAALFNGEPQDFMGKAFKEIHPESDEKYLRRLQEIIDSGVSKEYEDEIAFPGGSYWLLSRVHPIPDARGMPRYAEIISQDITERKRAEEALRLEREQLLSIFDSIDEMIYVADPDTYEILYANKALEKAFQKDLIGGLCYRELQGLDSPCHFCTNDIIRKQKYAPYSWERHNPILNRNYAVTDRIIKWPDGRDVRFELAIDVTERVRAEKALQESEHKFRMMSEQSILAIGIIQDGVFKYVNQAYCEITGYSIDEIMSWKPYEVARIIHPDDREFVMEQLRKKQTGALDVVTHYKFKGITRKGEMKWLEVYSKTVLYQGKNADLFVFVDITDRVRAEEELQHSNQRLMILHDIERNIVMAHSPEKIANNVLNHLRRLVPCWQATVVLYEQETAEIVILASDADGDSMVKPGMRFPDPKGRMSYKLMENCYVVKDLLALPEPLSPAVRLAISEGTRSYLSVLLLAEDKLIGGLVLGSKTPAAFSDQDAEITREVANQLAIAIHQAQLKEQIERHSLELEQRVVQRTEQLESANKELESFTYSVSHDLRAPLRAINGFAAIVARRHCADLNEEGRHYVDNIVLASKRMGYLIDDLLQYSRLGRSSIRRERVPLNEIFESLASDVATRLAEVGGTLHIPDELPAVMGDRTLLSQVFGNILENAITYRQPDVPVQVTVSCRTEDKNSIICIGDNGIGIPSEYLEKIFNIFQRLHSDEEYPGTGIGLATVQKSTELLNGQVWVESIVGRGSNFFVKLPKE